VGVHASSWMMREGQWKMEVMGMQMDVDEDE
jgi:hypothetical protein